MTNYGARWLILNFREAITPAYLRMPGASNAIVVDLEEDIYLLALRNMQGDVLKYGFMHSDGVDELKADLKAAGTDFHEYALAYIRGFKYCYYSARVSDYAEYRLTKKRLQAPKSLRTTSCAATQPPHS